VADTANTLNDAPVVVIPQRQALLAFRPPHGGSLTDRSEDVGKGNLGDPGNGGNKNCT
jgi:hypothetical protein